MRVWSRPGEGGTLTTWLRVSCTGSEAAPWPALEHTVHCFLIGRGTERWWWGFWEKTAGSSCLLFSALLLGSCGQSHTYFLPSLEVMCEEVC